MLPSFLTTIFFALSAVFAYRTTRLLGSMPANFWRILLGTLLLSAWAHTWGGGLGGKGLPFFFISGCIGFGLGDVALFLALPRLGSRPTMLLMHCLAAPIGALTEWLWIGTTLSTPQMTWSAVILTGVAIALAPGKHLKLSRKQLLLGTLFGCIAAFGQGFGAVVSSKAYEVVRLSGEHVDGITAAYQRILGGLLIAAIALTVATLCGASRHGAIETSASQSHGTRAWFWVLLNALAGPVLGVSCYQWALAGTPSGVVLSFVALTPIVVIPMAFLMEGDRPSPRSLVGGAIAVAGSVGLAMVN